MIRSGPRQRPALPVLGEGLKAKVHVATLPAPLSEGLHRLARASGVPVKSVLLAASLRVLAEHAGRTDVMTGLVVNGRPEKTDGDRASGLFLNTVPLRLDLAGGTWTDLLRHAFAAEAEVRWLDHCEARLARAADAPAPVVDVPQPHEQEVRR